MCLAVPMQIRSIDEFTATCEAKGVQREVSLFMMQNEGLAPGDHVLVHVGYAIQKVTEAIQERELPAMFILGERYVEAIRQMSGSENAKIVMVPADIPAAVRGLMGNPGK